MDARHFDITDITKNNVPAWCTFSVSKEPPYVISISVHKLLKDIIINRLQPGGRSLLREYLTEGTRHQRIDLPEFITPNNSHWGYKGLLVSWENISGKPDWIDIKCPIPAETGDYKGIIALCGLLESLFDVISLYPIKDTGAKEYQIINPSGISGGIELSAEVTNWITNNSEQRPIPYISEAMRDISHYMGVCKTHNAIDSSNGFYASAIPPKHLCLFFPIGNVCGLAPSSSDHYSTDANEGLTLQDQNVDNLIQWLVLRIGIILVTQIIRESRP